MRELSGGMSLFDFQCCAHHGPQFPLFNKVACWAGDKGWRMAPPLLI